jgi:hypothetical protein
LDLVHCEEAAAPIFLVRWLSPDVLFVFYLDCIKRITKAYGIMKLKIGVKFKFIYQYSISLDHHSSYPILFEEAQYLSCLLLDM